MLNISTQSDEPLTMPDVSTVFASAAAYGPYAGPAAKLAGGADSARNQHTSVKAPGGTDASHQKDGG